MIDLESKHKEVVLIGDGPSSEIIYKKPGFTIGKSVCVINRAGLKWRHEADFWCSFHSHKMLQWYLRRQDMGLPDVYPVLFNKNYEMEVARVPFYYVDYNREEIREGGSSSYFACEVLLRIGYQHVHLFGVDLNGPKYQHFRGQWKELQGKPLTFYGDQWFHEQDFRM